MLNDNLDTFISRQLINLKNTSEAKESYEKFLSKVKEKYGHKEVLRLEELLNSCVAEGEHQAYKKGLQDGLALAHL